MDKERLDSLFASWKKKDLLTRRGSLKVGRSMAPFLIGVPLGFFIFGITCGMMAELDVHFSIPIACGVSSFLLFVQLFSVKHFYKDRVELFYLWGLIKRRHYYTDLNKIVHDNYYDSDSNRWVKTLSVSFKDWSFYMGSEFSSKTRFDCLTQLFSCFRSLFVNKMYEEQMGKLFAYVVTLKDDPQYQKEESQCALKYLSEVCKNSSAPNAFVSQKNRYNAYRRTNTLPADYGYISICLDILQNKGVCYADRLNLLSALFECAYASDGKVDDEELECLSHIAYYFCVKEWDFLSLKYRFESEQQTKNQRKGTEDAQQRERCQAAYSSRLREAYKILELKENATLEEVKAAYRTQVKTCHPDTLPPTAMASEREEATIRFRTITEAYDFLSLELNMERVVVS